MKKNKITEVTFDSYDELLMFMKEHSRITEPEGFPELPDNVDVFMRTDKGDFNIQLRPDDDLIYWDNNDDCDYFKHKWFKYVYALIRE